MKLLTADRDLGRAVAAAAIVGHARLAATPFDQLALTIAFDVGRAILRGVRQAAGMRESQHAPL
jgi:hypothetical protein